MLLLTGLVLVLTSFFMNQNRTFDIYIHDTYYVINQGHVFLFLAFIISVLWALYLVARKILYSKSLTWIHVIITLVTLLLLFFLLNFGSNILNPSSKRYLDANNQTFNMDEQYTGWIAYIIIALILGQVTFIVNLIIGIVKRVT